MRNDSAPHRSPVHRRTWNRRGTGLCFQRRVGTFSDVAVFSMTKHVKGAGGILAFSERQRRSHIQLKKPNSSSALRNACSRAGSKRVFGSLGGPTGTPSIPMTALAEAR